MNLKFWQKYGWSSSDEKATISREIEHAEKHDEFPLQLVMSIEGSLGNRSIDIHRYVEEISTSHNTRKIAIYRLVEIAELGFPPVVKSLKKFDENENKA